MPSQNRMESAAEAIEKRLNTDPQEKMRMILARSLAAGLDDSDSQKRGEAREQMLALGRAAIPALLSVLTDASANVRWQAAKALAQLHDPETAPDLIDAMEDDDFGVRWLAAEGLIAMGPACLETLLLSLMQCFDSIRIREGVRHVLHALADSGYSNESIEKLLHTLQGFGPAAEAGWAAEAAWDRMRTGGH